MTWQNLAGVIDRAGRLAAIGIGFSIPISTAADNVLLAVLLVCFVAGGAYRQRFSFVAANPVLTAAAALFGLLAAGAFFGPTPLKDALAFLLKYADLACIPAIAVFFRDPATRRHGLYAFSAAIVVTALASYAFFAGMPRYGLFVYDLVLPVAFKHSLTQALLLCFGAYVFVQFGACAATRAARWSWFSLAALAFANIIFVVPGRTAYAVAGALALYTAFAQWRFRGLSRMITVSALVVAMSYGTSPLFQDRINGMIYGYSTSDPGTPASINNSIGLRLEFYRKTLDIIGDHPLTGVGTGGFRQAYADRVQGTGMLATPNPHNEYLLIAVQVGVAGVLLLLYLFYVQWREAPRLASPLETHLARGLLLTIAIGCLFNSLLLDHAEGLLYAWLTGLLYAGLKSKSP